MPEICEKCKSNPTEINNLIYIMIFFQGGRVKKILGLNKFTPRESLFTPLMSSQFDLGYKIKTGGPKIIPCSNFKKTEFFLFYEINVNLRPKNEQLTSYAVYYDVRRLSSVYPPHLYQIGPGLQIQIQNLKKTFFKIQTVHFDRNNSLDVLLI